MKPDIQLHLTNLLIFPDINILLRTKIERKKREEKTRKVKKNQKELKNRKMT